MRAASLPLTCDCAQTGRHGDRSRVPKPVAVLRMEDGRSGTFTKVILKLYN